MGTHLLTIEIGDCETDNLLPKMTKLHMLQLGTADGEDVTIYCDTAPPEEVEKARSLGFTAPVRPLAEGVERLRAAERAVFHNLVGFDLPAINRFYPGLLTLERDLDTLVMARLKDPGERQHSLEAWGRRMELFKGDYKGDFQQVDAELLVYAEQDVRVGRALWHKVKETLEWSNVVDLEQRFAHVMRLQEAHGFLLDLPKVQNLYADLRQEMTEVEAELQRQFPPLEKTTIFIPKRPNKSKGYQAGVPIEKRKLVTFNPGSTQHIAERLMALGWKPREFTESGHPAVTKTVLQTMRHPSAKVLLRYTELAKRAGQIADGKTGWLKVVDANGIVRGRVIHIGAESGRCSHSAPNMANVNKKDLRLREVWIASPGRKLIGVDGDGIQARAFAHFLSWFDKGAFTDRLLNGSKKTRTDVHSANLAALIKAGLVPMALDAPQDEWDHGRDHVAKRCLYASWFGASDKKIGWTLKDGCRTMGLKPPSEPAYVLGKAARQALNRAMRGMDKLDDLLTKTVAKRGYLISPSGRRVPIRKKHTALVYLLQATEADIMKLAAVLFHFEVAPANGWKHGEHFDYCAHVHDETQIEANADIAEAVGDAYAACIGRAAELLQLKCPHLGSRKVGANWAETH